MMLEAKIKNMEDIKINEKEEITTWAAKIPVDLKNKISAFIKEEDISSKDFMSNLINLYEIDKLKKNSGIERDVAEFQDNLMRISEIFKTALVRNNSIESNLEKKYNQLLEQKEQEINQKEQEIKQKDIDLEKVKELLENKTKELSSIQKNVKELENLTEKLHKEISKTDELLLHYKNQIETQEKRIINLETIEKSYEKVSNEITEYKEAIKSANNQVEIIKAQIQEREKNHENYILTLTMEKNEAISSLKEKHQLDIISLTNKSSDEIKNYVLEISSLKEALIKEQGHIDILKLKLENITSQH